MKCNKCGRDVSLDTLEPFCKTCSGLFEIKMNEPVPKFTPEEFLNAINRSDQSLWRYEKFLPVNKVVSLGEGYTPYVPSKLFTSRLFKNGD